MCRICILLLQRYVPPSLYENCDGTNGSQKAHPTLTRDGDDLHTIITLDLKEALTGWSRKVSTIDGKQLNVSGSGPTPPGYIERYPNLGMVKSKSPNERGDFLVEVKVKFPTSLTSTQKNELKKILP